MIAASALGFAILLALLYMVLVSAHNYANFPRLASVSTSDQSESLPSVSILVPARNEAETLPISLPCLLDQCYAAPYEIILLDDASTDGTSDVAALIARGDTRLRVIPGLPLPPGWTGKNWACHQLSQVATGELLLFTDADVLWGTSVLSRAVHYATSEDAGLLTIWPTQILRSISERLVVPLMSFAVLAYLPVGWVHNLPNPSAAAANGQFMLFTRDAYAACGGHAAVRERIVDDVSLARRVKAARMQLRTADAASLIQTRMYRNWSEVRRGFAKNILEGHGNSIPLLLLSTIFHLSVFVLPWLWLLFGSSGARAMPILLIVLGLTARAITARIAQQPLREVPLMPVSVLLMTVIALQAIWWRLRDGGPQWKDRTLAGLHLDHK